MGSREAVQHTSDARRFRVVQEGERICFGLARVQHQRPSEFRGECELRTQHAALLVAGRMIVVKIEATLTDGDSTTRHGVMSAWVARSNRCAASV